MSKRIEGRIDGPLEDMTDAEINELKRRAIERLTNPKTPRYVQSERVQDDDAQEQP